MDIITIDECLEMDSFIKTMDFPVKHWAPFPRKFPSRFQINSADLMKNKTQWVNTSFRTCNFLLILRGNGVFRQDDKTWDVQAPCAVVHRPHVHAEYGPNDGETWDEFYLIYPAFLTEMFEESRIIADQQIVWPILDLIAVNEQISDLEQLAKTSMPEVVVDRVDRVCERILLETRLQPRFVAEEERAIYAILHEARQNLRTALDFDEMAGRAGMSASTFRRRWAAFSDIPPARYLSQLRLREACRLLVETRDPIFQIAHAVGFDDELYFSRRFHREIHMPPREYRRLHQIPRTDLFRERAM